MDRRDQTLIGLVMTLDLGKLVLFFLSYNDFLLGTIGSLDMRREITMDWSRGGQCGHNCYKGDKTDLFAGMAIMTKRVN
jgi:hypothetical protein